MSEARAVPSLLRPQQVKDHRDDIARLKHQLTQPHLQNPGFVGQQIRGLEKTLAEYAPKEFEGVELDAAVKREKELRTEISGDGMPTAQEMRKNPPGAVHKHLQFEQRNKPKLNEWRYLRRRLFAKSEDPDAGNFEPYRPKGDGSELSMDGAQIAGQDFHFGAAVPTYGSVMTKDESVKLKELDPELYGLMVTADGEARAKILDVVRNIMAEEAALDAVVNDEKPGTMEVLSSKTPKRKLSPAHLEKMKLGREKAAAKKAAEAQIAA